MWHGTKDFYFLWYSDIGTATVVVIKRGWLLAEIIKDFPYCYTQFIEFTSYHACIERIVIFEGSFIYLHSAL